VSDLRIDQFRAHRKHEGAHSRISEKTIEGAKMNALTPAQLAQYRDDGYVILGKVMDMATLQSMRAEEGRFRLRKLARQPELGHQTVFVSQVCHYSEPVRRFCTGAPHLEFVKQLVGPNVSLWFTQFVTKNPDARSGKSEFPWH
jgi:hypothetical protein